MWVIGLRRLLRRDGRGQSALGRAGSSSVAAQAGNAAATTRGGP
ncbi:hypothetical protein [Mycobacterium sp.]